MRKNNVFAGWLWNGLLWTSVTAASELPGLDVREQEVNLRALPQEFKLAHYTVVVILGSE